MKSFAIGSSEDETVSLTVLNYMQPLAGNFYDDNWLLCQVAIRAGAFRGTFQANFLTSELEGLRQGLENLHKELRGDYVFDPMEGQLVLRAACDSLGHIHIAGKAMDQAGIGHGLSFKLSVDQTYMAETLRELSSVVRTFPVRA
ncbi:WapI family immunity protein [Lysobacter sp. A289]